MTRPAVLLLILSTLLAMLTMPAVAVSESTTEPAAISSSDSAVVQATFFFSPDCGHCEHVITQTLPAIFADNGGQPVVTYDQDVSADQLAFYLMSNGQLQMLMVDVSTEDGSAMFQADSVRLGMDRAGVPRLDLLEDTYLVGSGDIPVHFPGIVEEGLVGDGIAWPPVPGIDAALAPFIEEGSVAGLQAEVPPGSTEEPVAAIEPTAEPEFEPGAVVLPVGGDDDDVLDKVGKDPVGNGLAIIVLIALVLSAIGAPLLAARGSLPTFPSWLVFVLVIVGVGSRHIRKP